mmetsp:Transcript_10712/g.23724  ORF Transcript_10712/g.23724 Transcript_10712/m.23724 type:complete len:781 (-) Transcript_10712:56-2398(-)|eukprot:CAMPEP_0172313006 /NCGR_PEP_ID=MMETSP1058-20130122/19099_1 /TAXON_ID=83371 /ORGANISM="Detonula confervacea, Strain CCMP 353" /LENGTH=780 /DNA_ID=CAMNT_0013026585 /DNA_START=65 /DNA_END=2407 /DNA_ORIENTATION=+
MKTYCALGFGNNFFYPLGTDSLPIPPNLLQELEDEEGDNDGGDGSDEGEVSKIENEDDGKEERPGAQVSLLPINLIASGQIDNSTNEDHEFTSGSEWLQSHLPSQPGDKNTKYSTNIQPLVSCGATHTSFVLPKQNNSTSSPRSAVAAAGEAHLVGTIFGHTYHNLTVHPSRLPLRIIRVSSGRRHVLALTEGASPGGGVVMSWGAGHFGQLGHGPDLTSCLEPRIVERLLPHVVGGNVIEIAAGGLHSAAIVASSSKNQKSFPSSTNGDGKESIVIRETKTFAWGSNRKGQCGIEGGKCATVPEPLPVILVKRVELSKMEGDGNTKANAVDKNVHFEKLSLGRLHTVAMTAYGEVFTWGSTSMGRCGHSSMDSGKGSDRRFVQQPRHVSALRNVSIEAIAAGAAHTLALSKGGRVFAWGAGSDGQCGQGHAGNLFSPRAVQGLPSSSSPLEKIGSKLKMSTNDSAKGKDANEEENMPRVNSKVAMAVTMEEEALSKALSMSQISNISPSSPQPKSDKIMSIRASGCYSAAITADGEVYTWGYGSGVALGHPIPSEETSCLPMIPIIEGNQYSTTTAAKVYPAGGSDDNKIRDCRCFDTDLNVMWPRKVECTRTLGLRAEDVSLGPGHMVMLCSIRGSSDDSGISNSAQSGQSLHNKEVNGQDSETDTHSNIITGEANQSGASGSGQGLSSLNDAHPGVTSNNESGPLGEVGTAATFESNDSSKSEKRRRSPGWMTKIKSSRTSKHCPSQSLPEPESEKKKSFMHMGKMLDVALRRGGEK